jgi:predicted regulator of Ras-like GTPase activity (Roadblock/LC7/MglB family)
MIRALKKIFRKPAAAQAVSPPSAAPAAEPPSNSAAQAVAELGTSVPVNPAIGDLLTIPLSAIIQQVPREFYGQLAPAGVAHIQLTVPRQRVLEQLPQGAVKVPFAELRQLAPPGVFVESDAGDSRMVDLPLSEILRQLAPQDYARRPDRPRVEVPDDVTDLFGQKGESLTPVRVLGKDDLPKPALPASKLVPGAPKPAAAAGGRVPPATKPILFPAGLPSEAAASAAQVWAPPIGTTAGGDDSGAGQDFLIPLESVAAQWPEAIRQEIAQMKLPHARCALPAAEICEGLKVGKLNFTWADLRARLLPAPPPELPTLYAEAVLELPLNVVTPLFLEFLRASPTERQRLGGENTTAFYLRFQGAASNMDKDRPAPALAKPSVAPAAPPATSPPPKAASPVAAAPRVAPAPAVPAVVMAKPVPASKPAPIIPPPVAPAPPPAVAPPPGGVLPLPLSAISRQWPEAARKQIDQLKLGDARLEIPFTALESGLKQGKLEFTWGQLCAWLQPTPPASASAIPPDTTLPLPLNVVVPLYLRHQPPAGPAKKITVAANIPDVFAVDTPASAPAAPAAPPAPVAQPPAQAAAAPPPDVSPPLTPAPRPVAAPAAPPAPVKPPSNLAELFGEPQKRQWTPNEIVNKTVQLPGVDGALIALQDGLLVAGCMPPAVKGETIAAFLPQIMGRMSQYAKEFKMGALRNLTFVVDQGVLQIFSTGVIYFAVLGKPGAALPAGQLNLIAAELGRHSK